MNPTTFKESSAFHPPISEEKFHHKGWDFVFSRSIIMKSTELDKIASKLKLQNIPEIVFDNNICQIKNQTLNFLLEYNPFDSLQLCNFETRRQFLLESPIKSFNLNHISILPSEIQVKHAEIWKNKKPIENTEIKVLEKVSDCFYSSPYKGTIHKLSSLSKGSIFELSSSSKGTTIHENIEVDSMGASINKKIDSSSKDTIQEKIDYSSKGTTIHEKIDSSSKSTTEFSPYLESTDEEIPIGNLKENNPIIWANVINLWEDELGDNGISNCEFRFRVMNDCFFGLLRHYLRVDDVMIRIYDTRIYHEFGRNYMIREFTVREDSYEALKEKGFKFTPQWMTDPGQSFGVADFVKICKSFKEKIYFS